MAVVAELPLFGNLNCAPAASPTANPKASWVLSRMPERRDASSADPVGTPVVLFCLFTESFFKLLQQFIQIHSIQQCPFLFGKEHPVEGVFKPVHDFL